MEWNQKIGVSFNQGNERRNTDMPFSFNRTSGFSQEGDLSRDDNKIAKFLDSVIKFSIFAIFFGVPLFFTGLTFQGIDFEKQIYFYFWILVALVAWGAKSGYVGEMKIRKTSLDIPIIAFWFFYLIVTIFSIDRWHSFVGFFGDPSRGFVSITAMIVLYYLILSNFSEGLFKWITKGLVFSGILAIAWELLRILNIHLFLPGSFWSSLPISTVGSLQSSAVFACFMVPIFIMAILKLQSDESLPAMKKNIYSAILSAFIIGAFLIILALYNYLPIYGRFPLVGLVIGSAFFLIFVLAKIVRPKETWTLFPMVVFILVLAFLMIGTVNISKVNLPYNVSIPYATSFEIAKDSVKDNFFLGYGPANYGYAFSKFLPQNFDNFGLRFFQGEGIFLESLSTIGVIGTILFLIIVLTFLGTSIFLLYREKERNKIYSLGITSATLVLLANALIAQAEASIVILLAVMVALTTGTLFMESDVREKFLAFSLKASPKFALTLAFISLLIFASVAFLFVFFGKIYLADVYIAKSSKTAQASEDGSVAMIGKAINLNGREGRYYTRLGQEYMALTNQEMLKGEKDRDINKIQLYLSTAVQAGMKGADMMRNDITSVEALAQIYGNSGMYLAEGLTLAEQEYNKALVLEPHNPELYDQLGQIKTKLAGTKEKPEERKQLVQEAKDLFQKSVDMRNNYPAGYYDLALAQEILGDLDGAIDNMTKAASLQGNSVNYVFNLARLFQERGKNDDYKTAESLFKQILAVNDKEINTHFNLGLLYEKIDRKQEAIKEYSQVMELLPEGSDSTKSQLEKMISNIKKGVENTPDTLGLTENQNTQAEQVQQPEIQQ